MNLITLLAQIGASLLAYGEASAIVTDENHCRMVFPFLGCAHFRWANLVDQPAVRLRRPEDDLRDLLRAQAE